MVFVFWISVAAVAHVYIGYPLIMWFLSQLKSNRREPSFADWPTVSLIIAAHNEELGIADKLANSLILDYPSDKLDIIVASDGSTDRTDSIVTKFRSRGIHLIRIDGRQGKTAAQNAAAAAATGEIIVFSDANALYAPHALRRLVRHFSSDDIGCVEGRRLDFSPTASATARHELTYRDLESRIKMWESRVLSCTGATGPIYAVRRALYVPLGPAMISDLMEPICIMSRHGKRHVFEPGAVSRESTLPDMRDEFQRKVRIMTRCLNSLKMAPEVLNPLRTGWFAVQIISHRLLRWLAPAFALAAFGANVFLLDQPLYRATMCLQVLVAVAMFLGWISDLQRVGPGWLRLPYYFGAANLAALLAIRNCVLGRNVVAWRTQRA